MLNRNDSFFRRNISFYVRLINNELQALSFLLAARSNRPFPSCFEPRYESEAKCKVLIMK